MKMNVRKLLALFLVCLMAASLAACGETKPASSASPGGVSAPAGTESSNEPVQPDRVLNIAVEGDPGSLLPLAAAGAGGFLSVARTVYDAPWNTKADGSLEFMLVESFDTISDIQYTFHLRKGVTFSNGNPFTAEDFIFSMELSRDHPQHYLNVAAIDFEKTSIIDDYTIDLWLTHYDVGQWPGMALMYICDKESYDEESMALKPIGTGAYVVTEYIPNSHVTMEAREDYWGEPPAIKKVIYHVKAEDSQRVNALTTGDIDCAVIPIKDFDYVQSLGNYNVTLQSSAAVECAFFNLSPDGVLGTLEARLAVMYAIDRQAILDMVYGGKISAPSWPVSDATYGYEPKFANLDVYTHGYDVEKAKAYAEASGLVSKTIRITTNGEQNYNSIAEIIQNNLSEIGVDSTIINYDAGSYVGTLMDASTFDIGILYVGSPSRYAVDMIGGYLSFLPLGWSGSDKDELLALCREGVSTPTESGRSEILEKMMKIWDKYHPWFALAEMVSPTVVSKDIGGYEAYADGCYHVCNWYWK